MSAQTVALCAMIVLATGAALWLVVLVFWARRREDADDDVVDVGREP